MTSDNIAKAVAEAAAFIEAAVAVEAERAAGALDFVGTKASGALRRKSMDLTRALSEMRG